MSKPRIASQKKNLVAALAVRASSKTYIEGLGDKLLIASKDPKFTDLLGTLLAAGAIIKGKEMFGAVAMEEGFIELIAHTPVTVEISSTGIVNFLVGDQFLSRWGLGRKRGEDKGVQVQIDKRMLIKRGKDTIKYRDKVTMNLNEEMLKQIEVNGSGAIDNLRKQFENMYAVNIGKEQKKVSSKEEETNNKKNLVFISHASKDAPIIREFIDNILKNGLELKDENIVCTSFERTTVEPGESIPAYIKDNIEKATVVLAMVSEAYVQSEVCQNEMGMAVAFCKKPISITLPNANFEKISWINNLDKAIRIDDTDSLNHLQETLCKRMGLKINSALHWGPCVGKFLKVLEKFK